MKKILISLLLIFSFIPVCANADNKVTLHLFYGETCPHCHEELLFLDEYLKDNDDVTLEKYEVWNNNENQELLIKVQKALDNHDSGVPYLVIGDRVILGYMEGITDVSIKQYVKDFKKDNWYSFIMCLSINFSSVI